MIMPYPRSKNKMHNLILETLELEEQVGNLLLKIDENKKSIQKYFDEENIKEMKVPISDEGDTKEFYVLCKKSERVTIKYDIEKLKQKLNDELFMEVTDRTYVITDINEMIKLMKDAGVRAKDFKALIDTKISVDREALKKLYEVGEISMKMLKGAYTATISKSIKITEEGDKD